MKPSLSGCGSLSPHLARQDGEDAGGEAARGASLTVQGVRHSLPVPHELGGGGAALAGAGQVDGDTLRPHRSPGGDDRGPGLDQHCYGDLRRTTLNFVPSDQSLPPNYWTDFTQIETGIVLSRVELVD